MWSSDVHTTWNQTNGKPLFLSSALWVASPSGCEEACCHFPHIFNFATFDGSRTNQCKLWLNLDLSKFRSCEWQHKYSQIPFSAEKWVGTMQENSNHTQYVSKPMKEPAWHFHFTAQSFDVIEDSLARVFSWLFFAHQNLWVWAKWLGGKNPGATCSWAWSGVVKTLLLEIKILQIIRNMHIYSPAPPWHPWSLIEFSFSIFSL